MTPQMTTLAAVSMHVDHDPKKNYAEYERYIAEAAEENAKLLVFPECSLQGFIWTWDEEKRIFHDDPEQRLYYQKTAETVPGPTTQKLAKLAEQHAMYIQFGLVERASKNGSQIMYNTAAMVGPEGLLGAHRKVHGAPNPIFGYGTDYNVYPTKLGKMGSVICADLAHLETARIMALKGAEIIVNSSAWSIKEAPENDGRGYRYELLCMANAAFNQVWFVSSNEVGRGGHSVDNCYGHSLIINPSGKIVADGGYKEGLVSARVDLKQGFEDSVKIAGRFMRRRRVETYKDILAITAPKYE